MLNLQLSWNLLGLRLEQGTKVKQTHKTPRGQISLEVAALKGEIVQFISCTVSTRDSDCHRVIMYVTSAMRTLLHLSVRWSDNALQVDLQIIGSTSRPNVGISVLSLPSVVKYGQNSVFAGQAPVIHGAREKTGNGTNPPQTAWTRSVSFLRSPASNSQRSTENKIYTGTHVCVLKSLVLLFSTLWLSSIGKIWTQSSVFFNGAPFAKDDSTIYSQDPSFSKAFR